MEEIVDEKDMSWLAGFFDGEGCISIAVWKDAKKPTHRSGYIGSVSLSNNILSVLKEVDTITRQFKQPLSHTTLAGHCHVISWTGIAGTELLIKLLPYLRNPRQIERAKVYMEFFSPKRYCNYQQVIRDRLWEEWLKLRAS